MTPLQEPIEITAQERIDAEVAKLPDVSNIYWKLIELLYHKEQGLLEMKAELESLKEKLERFKENMAERL